MTHLHSNKPFDSYNFWSYFIYSLKYIYCIAGMMKNDIDFIYCM